MYEGQPIICQSIIEENWLEYLRFVKEQYEKEQERSRKRQEAIAKVEATEGISGGRGLVGNEVAEKVTDPSYHHYYDLNISGFWNWYVSTKV
jgi:hypothetical protein